VAEDAPRRRQRCSHPTAPFVLEDWRDREHSLLNRYQAPRGNPVCDRFLTQAEAEELPARNAIELPPGQLGDLSVPHAPVDGTPRDVRPPELG
jgi:hypothetical protein